jgi:hypothetical protein
MWIQIVSLVVQRYDNVDCVDMILMLHPLLLFPAFLTLGWSTLTEFNEHYYLGLA